jgi:hypothetical protein
MLRQIENLRISEKYCRFCNCKSRLFLALLNNNFINGNKCNDCYLKLNLDEGDSLLGLKQEVL